MKATAFLKQGNKLFWPRTSPRHTLYTHIDLMGRHSDNEQAFVTILGLIRYSHGWLHQTVHTAKICLVRRCLLQHEFE
jgi:hypothetical protein